MQALYRAVDHGLGDFQQVPHGEDFRTLGALQLFATVERGGRGAVQQVGSEEQGVFEADVVADGVEVCRGLRRIGRQVVVERSGEGGAVFGLVTGWIGDNFKHGIAPD